MDWNNFWQVEANKFLQTIDNTLVTEITEQMCDFLWIDLFVDTEVEWVGKVKRTFEDVYNLLINKWYIMNHEVYSDPEHKQTLEVQFFKMLQKRKVNLKTKFSFEILKQWQITEDFE